MTDEVVIAGAGVAGSALALALLARGFGVTLRARPARVAQPAVEALPEHAVRLLAELGGAEALARAEPAVVRGFASHWDRARPGCSTAGGCTSSGRRLLASCWPRPLPAALAS